MEIRKLITRKQVAVAAASAAAGTLATASHAAVIFTPANTVVSSAGSSSTDLDLNHDGTTDFTITADTTAGIQISKHQTLDNVNGIIADANNTSTIPDPANANALALHAGDTVQITDGNTNHLPLYTTYTKLISADGASGNFTVAGGPAYIGVSVVPLDLTSGGGDYAHAEYGYIKFQTLSTGSVVSGEVLGYAYDSTVNEVVTIPAAPEPTSLAMLAMGAVGVAAYGRRRRGC